MRAHTNNIRLCAPREELHAFKAELYNATVATFLMQLAMVNNHNGADPCTNALLYLFTWKRAS